MLCLKMTQIYDALRYLVPFVKFKNREKHPWRSVKFSEVADWLKLTLLHGCFSRLNCTNGTKSRNASHLSYSENIVRQLFATMNDGLRKNAYWVNSNKYSKKKQDILFFTNPQNDDIPLQLPLLKIFKS